MGKVETVKVKTKKGDVVVINKSDYDADKHTLVEEKSVSTAAKPVAPSGGNATKPVTAESTFLKAQVDKGKK